MVLDLKGIQSALVANGYLVTNAKNNVITIELNINFKKVVIDIDLGHGFPTKLPVFYLRDRNQYGMLAHVNTLDDDTGVICIGDSDTFCIDTNSPIKVVTDSLHLAVSLLTKLLTDSKFNLKEAYKEFVAIWNLQISTSGDLSQVDYFGDGNELIAGLSIYEQKNDKPTSNFKHYIAIGNSSINPENVFYKKRTKEKQRLVGVGCLINIAFNELIPPPSPKDTITSWLSRQLANLSSEKLKKIKNYARTNKANQCKIIFSSTVENMKICFAISGRKKNSLSSSKQKLPLYAQYLPMWELSPTYLSTYSRHSLLPRSGATIDINEKKVCLIGCGSVGGHIAEMLAESGICQITLCDFDTLNKENLHRHASPSYAFGSSKTSGLALEINSKYPYCKAEIGPRYLKECMDDSFISLFDMVIVATGNSTLERELNQWIYQQTNLKPTFIYTWLEAMGVGGHAVAVIPNKKGCLHCTYISNETDEPCLDKNINFITPGQSLLANYAGCGSEYLPYSGADARDTASLCARLAIQCLDKKPTQGLSHSWRGDAVEAIKNDIELTYRYHNAHNNQLKFEHYRDTCDICNPKTI
uniref:Uncharacterized protein n=1 Tax=Aliivibrio wodanis TaxID=80852 RepID=A0A5Q4ZUK4_9GAMM|nr:hypothetical protein [synthetic construct]VVV03659.1 hypothetical protein AW0309160_01042 [Aliivibrio wodanis]